MSNLLDLANYLNKIADEVKEETTSYSVQFALKCYIKLQELSPVDTSELISNWVITLNTKIANGSDIDPYFKGSKGSTGDISSIAATNKAIDVLKNKKPGDTIYITNLTPQVIYTNYGTSKIEPSYFIEASINYAKSNSNVANLTINTKATK